MTLRRRTCTLSTLRHVWSDRPLLGYTGGFLAVLVATIFSYQAHRAGLPEYLTLYPLTVASVSALGGMRQGLFAAVMAVVLNRIALVHCASALPSGTDMIRLLAISLSTLAAAALVGVVREQRDQLERAAGALEEGQASLLRAHSELQAAEARRDEFCRDILLAVSHGKLRLCSLAEMQPPTESPQLEADLVQPSDITLLRHAIADLARARGMEGERAQDLEVCLGEAATNALVHGGGGRAAVYADDERIWIHIIDAGPGIDQNELPRATLLKGYSTRHSLGMGFSIMQELADSIRLCTGSNGTQVLLEMRIQPPTRDPLDLAMLSLDLDEAWDGIAAPETVEQP